MREHGQRDYRQHHVVGYVSDLAPVAQLIVITAYQTVQIEPAQLYRERVLEQRGQEEGGQRYAHKSKNSDRIVSLGVLLARGKYAQRYADYDLKEEGDDVDYDGVADNALELFDNGDIVEPGVTKVALYCVFQPVRKAGEYVGVQMVYLVKFGKPLGVGFAAGQRRALYALWIPHMT